MYHQCGLSDSSSAKWGRYCQSSDCDHWHPDILAVSPRCPMNSSRVHVFPKPTPLLQCPCFCGCLHHWPSCADRKPGSPVTPPHPTQHCTPRTWNTVGAQQTGILPESHHSGESAPAASLASPRSHIRSLRRGLARRRHPDTHGSASLPEPRAVAMPGCHATPLQGTALLGAEQGRTCGCQDHAGGWALSQQTLSAGRGHGGGITRAHTS